MMNDNKSDVTDDEEMRDLFRPMRQLNAPSGLSERCFAAVQVSSDTKSIIGKRLQSAKSQRAFNFTSTVAASLLIGATIGWFLRGAESTYFAETKDLISPPEAVNPMTNAVAPLHLVNATSRVEYQEDVTNQRFSTSEMYVCGLGRIQSKSVFQISGESR
jgi:hypothetical protein